MAQKNSSIKYMFVCVCSIQTPTYDYAIFLTCFPCNL